MFGKLGRQRPDHGQIIGTRRDMRKQAADRESRFTVLLELPRARQHLAIVVELSWFDFKQILGVFAVVFVQQRLGVKRIDLRWPAIHVKEDHVLRFYFVVGTV